MTALSDRKGARLGIQVTYKLCCHGRKLRDKRRKVLLIVLDLVLHNQNIVERGAQCDAALVRSTAAACVRTRYVLAHCVSVCQCVHSSLDQ